MRGYRWRNISSPRTRITSRQAARSIALFREHTPREGWTVAALGEAGILPPEDAARLARCAIAPP